MSMEFAESDEPTTSLIMFGCLITFSVFGNNKYDSNAHLSHEKKYVANGHLPNKKASTEPCVIRDIRHTRMEDGARPPG